MKKLRPSKNIQFRITAAAAAVGIFSAALPSYTVLADTQDNLNAAQQQADSYSASGAQLSSELDSLLGDLNTSMENLADIDSQISEKNQQIADLSSQIAEDQAKASDMYESMALRVRYMYENSRSNSTVELLLSSQDFAEFLKRTSYVVSISTYDRSKLEELSSIINGEQQKKEQQESDLAALNELKDSQTAAQAGFEQMIAQKRAELQQNAQLLAEADSLVEVYRSQMEAEQEQIDNERIAAESARASEESQSSTASASTLESVPADTSSQADTSSETSSAAAETPAETSSGEETSAAQSQEETTAPASSSESSSSSSAASSGSSSASYSATELDVMAALMEGEAGPSNYDAEVAVGSCVMNRLNSGSYGSSVLEVIYAPGQFIASSQYSYMFEAILARGASASCYEAARAVLSGTITHPYVHFVSAKTAAARGISGTNIGGNVYY
ncbi:MAG: cell wall hydrolase [Lachnospiraceae bacterium]|nr:cell wall hydrolase [Lachnospiraceae bacterium]